MIQKIKKFYDETITEVKKCSWPPKNELINSTSLVIVTLIILMVWIAIIDKGSVEFIRWITNL